MMKNQKIECYNIDAKHFIKKIPDNSIDLIMTDPPYELDLNGGTGKYFKNKKLIKDKHIQYISNGYDYDFYFKEFIRITKKLNAIIFCSNKQVSKIMNWFESKDYLVTLLVWDKPNPIPLGNNVYLSDIEFIVYVRDKKVFFNRISYNFNKKCFKIPVPNNKFRIHPTEKPIKLLRLLLKKHSKPNDLICDPFAGSFSTAIASYIEKRNFIGSELDKKMFDKAMIRFDNYKRKNEIQLKLF